MRSALLALALLGAGCGTVVPYSLAPDLLAPDLVPEQPASVVVVTDRTEVGSRASVTGRIVDRDTGAPLAASVTVAGTALTATAAGLFATPTEGGDTRVRVALAGYAPAEAVVAVGVGERAEVLVLLGAER